MKKELILVWMATLAFAMANPQESLRQAYNGRFLIGTAVNENQAEEADASEASLIALQFDSITPENAMKWGAVQPNRGEFHFDAADRFVEFGSRHDMFVIGHTLVWHSQTPEWLFKDDAGNPVDRSTLLDRMREHIQTVVGRYKGRVKGWDVVNEALADDGTLRDSPWLRIIGEDYIAKAFQFAHEADPSAELYYNDYGIEGGAKRDAAIALMKKLKAEGVPVTGIGIQGHMSLDWPPVEMLDETISSYGDLGLKVMVTELDVDVLPSPWAALSADVNLTAEARPELNPYTEGLPEEISEKQARRYADLFAMFLRHPNVVSRVTFWGVSDRQTWLNNFPVKAGQTIRCSLIVTVRPRLHFTLCWMLLQLCRSRRRHIIHNHENEPIQGWVFLPSRD